MNSFNRNELRVSCGLKQHTDAILTPSNNVYLNKWLGAIFLSLAGLFSDPGPENENLRLTRPNFKQHIKDDAILQLISMTGKNIILNNTEC